MIGMSKKLLLLYILFLCSLYFSAADVNKYNVVWTTQSKNSSESMPCGGGDVGLNVWVENGNILFYMSRSGAFDENNTLLKQGRVRIHLSSNPFDGDKFSQELSLDEGCIKIKGENNGQKTTVRIWVDIFNPVIHVDIENNKNITAEIHYENWRYKDRLLRKKESNQNSYKWAAPAGLKTLKDSVFFDEGRILFYHRNKSYTVIDETVKQQGLSANMSEVYNPLKNLISGGYIQANGFDITSRGEGIYGQTDYRSWILTNSHPMRNFNVSIVLNIEQAENVGQWKDNLYKPVLSDKDKNMAWWKSFWQRSYIYILPSDQDKDAFQVAKNYHLFRYMLACNAYGKYPTKFNGGLFTFDPESVDCTFAFTPDFRKWGGGTFTAQNQRLVYFPMLKNGDSDMLRSQFDFYKKLLPVAELRSKIYWGHNGACFTEQLENCGLPNPSEYGWKRPEYFDKGLEYNAWLEYQWDTVLEFCYMILQYNAYTGINIDEYLPMIKSCLVFFDEHYQYLAKERGRKSLNEDGKLVLYPGSACETYKMAYNASSTIAALQTVTSSLLRYNTILKDSIDFKYFTQLKNQIPELPLYIVEGKTLIAPAKLWERINNVETPQLYPVYPWSIYGLGNKNLEVALNTWKYDKDAIRFRSHIGWKQDAIWAARLGLTEDAWTLTKAKLKDGNHRFPTFWGPGFDWTPDHNWGGSGMIALQEMLVQETTDSKIILLPSWPKDIDVSFKLHLSKNTIVQCKYIKGKITYLDVHPKERLSDIIEIN